MRNINACFKKYLLVQIWQKFSFEVSKEVYIDMFYGLEI